MFASGLDRNWNMFLIVVYSLAFFFLTIVVLVTGYSLSHPELGLTEKNPLVFSLVAEFGLVLGLLISVLLSIWLPLFLFVLFFVYLLARSKYNVKSILMDCLAYSGLSSYGLAMLTFYIINASNDVSWLLFHGSPPAITSLMNKLDYVFLWVLLISLFISSNLYFVTRKSIQK